MNFIKLSSLGFAKSAILATCLLVVVTFSSVIVCSREVSHPNNFEAKVVCPINYSGLSEVKIGYLANGILAFEKEFQDKRTELAVVEGVVGIKGIDTLDLGLVGEMRLVMHQIKVDQMLFDWYLEAYDYGRFYSQHLNCH